MDFLNNNPSFDPNCRLPSNLVRVFVSGTAGFSWTGLGYAIYDGNQELLETLLFRHPIPADVNGTFEVCDDSGVSSTWSPLGYLLKKSAVGESAVKVKMLQSLLGHQKLDLNMYAEIRRDECTRPLVYASRRGLQSAFDAMLLRGFDPFLACGEGMTCFTLAIYHYFKGKLGSKSVALMLHNGNRIGPVSFLQELKKIKSLEHIDINFTAKPLLCLCVAQYGDAKLAEDLLNEQFVGREVLVSGQIKSAVEYLVTTDDLDSDTKSRMAKVFVAPEVQVKEPAMLLNRAVDMNNTEILLMVCKILRGKVSLDVTVEVDGQRWTPLGYAINKELTLMVKVLLENGANPNLAFGKAGNIYPLELAMLKGSLAIGKLLLKEGESGVTLHEDDDDDFVLVAGDTVAVADANIAINQVDVAAVSEELLVLVVPHLSRETLAKKRAGSTLLEHAIEKKAYLLLAALCKHPKQDLSVSIKGQSVFQALQALGDEFGSLAMELKAEEILRVIIIGAGGSGKTRLCKALQGKEYKPGATNLVDLSDIWTRATDNGTARLSFWDFAGQAGYYAAQQILMGRGDRVVYLFCVDLRKSRKQMEQELWDWLDRITEVEGTVRVLVIGSHADESEGKKRSKRDDLDDAINCFKHDHEDRKHLQWITNIGDGKKVQMFMLFGNPEKLSGVDEIRECLLKLWMEGGKLMNPNRLEVFRVCTDMGRRKQNGMVMVKEIKVHVEELVEHLDALHQLGLIFYGGGEMVCTDPAVAANIFRKMIDLYPRESGSFTCGFSDSWYAYKQQIIYIEKSGFLRWNTGEASLVGATCEFRKNDMIVHTRTKKLWIKSKDRDDIKQLVEAHKNMELKKHFYWFPETMIRKIMHDCQLYTREDQKGVWDMLLERQVLVYEKMENDEISVIVPFLFPYPEKNNKDLSELGWGAGEYGEKHGRRYVFQNAVEAHMLDLLVGVIRSMRGRAIESKFWRSREKLGGWFKTKHAKLVLDWVKKKEPREWELEVLFSARKEEQGLRALIVKIDNVICSLWPVEIVMKIASPPSSLKANMLHEDYCKWLYMSEVPKEERIRLDPERYEPQSMTEDESMCIWCLERNSTKLCHGRKDISGFYAVMLVEKGGQGQVFKAKHPGLGFAAIKCFWDSDVRDWEEKALCRLGKVQVTSDGWRCRVVARKKVKVENTFVQEKSDRPLLLDWIEGKTFKSLIQDLAVSNQSWEEREVVDFALCFLRLIQGIHAKGVRHFDITPSNIMLDGDRSVVLLDFGACSLDGKSRAFRMEDNRVWIAPELRMGSGGEKSDVFSVGCILAQLWTGFSDEGVQEKGEHGLKVTVRSVHVCGTGWPENAMDKYDPLALLSLEKIIAKMCKRTEKDRANIAESIEMFVEYKNKK